MADTENFEDESFDLDELNESPDLTLIAVTAEKVPDILSELSEHNCHHAVIYSSGFAESGKDSKILNDSLKIAAKKNRITVLLISTYQRKENSNLLHAVFAILPFSLAKFAQNSHFFDQLLFINVAA